MINKKNVMDSLLGTDSKAFDDSVKELDCLIYRHGINDAKPNLSEPASTPLWTMSRGNVSVGIADGKAKIKIKVGGGDDTAHVPMRKLANIAVDAIMAELQKEEDQCSMEIADGKAKIKIKVGGGDDTTLVSMQKLANIAVDAIMAELQKEKAQ